MSDDTLDLTPRDDAEAPAHSPRKWFAVAAVVAVIAILGFVLFKFLSDSSLFFLNADEAVEQRDDLGDDRFRIQGTPVPGTISETTVEAPSQESTCATSTGLSKPASSSM